MRGHLDRCGATRVAPGWRLITLRRSTVSFPSCALEFFPILLLAILHLMRLAAVDLFRVTRGECRPAVALSKDVPKEPVLDGTALFPIEEETCSWPRSATRSDTIQPNTSDLVVFGGRALGRRSAHGTGSSLAVSNHSRLEPQI